MSESPADRWAAMIAMQAAIEAAREHQQASARKFQREQKEALARAQQRAAGIHQAEREKRARLRGELEQLILQPLIAGNPKHVECWRMFRGDAVPKVMRAHRKRSGSLLATSQAGHSSRDSHPCMADAQHDQKA